MEPPSEQPDIGVRTESYWGTIYEIRAGNAHATVRCDDESDPTEYSLEVRMDLIKAREPIRKGQLLRVRWQENKLIEACIVYPEPFDPARYQQMLEEERRILGVTGPDALPEAPPLRDLSEK